MNTSLVDNSLNLNTSLVDNSLNLNTSLVDNSLNLNTSLVDNSLNLNTSLIDNSLNLNTPLVDNSSHIVNTSIDTHPHIISTIDIHPRIIPLENDNKQDAIFTKKRLSQVLEKKPSIVFTENNRKLLRQTIIRRDLARVIIELQHGGIINKEIIVNLDICIHNSIDAPNEFAKNTYLTCPHASGFIQSPDNIHNLVLYLKHITNYKLIEDWLNAYYGSVNL
jgi:hypothetical protein